MADDPLDTPTSAPEFVSAWLEAIDSSSDEEKSWREDADKAVKAYRSEGRSGSRRFNIYHANVETIVPALYNSTPVPDVRERFNDDNPVSVAVGDMLERAIVSSIDTYDFDDLMVATVRDLVMASRGLARVRYRPVFDDGDERVVDETVTSEYVPWRSFRRGPGRVWSDVTWIAFEHFLDADEVARLILLSGVPLATGEVPFTYSASAKAGDDKKDAPRFGKRARAWEIWDRDTRTAIFICPDYGYRPLLVMPDPLGLDGFFPIPMPMNGLATTDSLVPVTSLSVYQDLLHQLDEVTGRITNLVRQLRPRGGFATQFADLERIATAKDGELVPLQGLEQALGAPGGNIANLIAWFPLEPTANALKVLLDQRQEIKGAIYEVSGLSDIVRGASDAAETATAQQIKTAWGSLRIQRMQAEVARFARDLFRLKAETMAKHMSIDTLLRIANLEAIPPQAIRDAARQRLALMAQAAQQMGGNGGPPMAPPQPDPQDIAIAASVSREEVAQILQQDALRGYRIDIESDSTIRGDVVRLQQQQAQFIQGSGAFFQAVVPAIEGGIMPAAVAVEIFASFARSLKLGKQVEDVLDKWAKGQQGAGPGAGGPAKPDPGAQRIQGQIAHTAAQGQVEQAKAQGQAQIIALKDQAADRAHARAMQAADRDDQSMAFRAQLGPVKTVDFGRQPAA